MNTPKRLDWARDLFMPTLLFASLGGMTWAVRGCSGYGGSMGCVFAGVTWGAAWWFISRESTGRSSRPYASGWVVLALMMGIGYSGGRGWMQWSSFFDGRIQLDTGNNIFAPISPAYGFLWLFIAGMPWAGLGACLLAWCNAESGNRLGDWALRLACGVGAFFLATVLFRSFPCVFLPLYKSLQANYQDLEANPNLRRLINDNRAAIQHLGLYLGFLGYEVLRRNRRNVTLILTVGMVNGLGWALCQNWRWAVRVWPEGQFNWWRCWESSGGISIGIALGIAYFLVNRPVLDAKASLPRINANRERFGLYFGLLLGLGLSIRNGLKGWANIYLGNEEYWSRVLWIVIGPIMLLLLILLIWQAWRRPLKNDFAGDVFPRAYEIIWAVIVIQHILGQLVTGPASQWNEVAFKIYYVLLFFITAVILHATRLRQRYGQMGV